MSEYRVHFNLPTLIGNELAYVQQALDNGKIGGDGSFTRRCHGLLEEVLSVPKALLTTSCTHALELAALLLEVGPGDEVILPSFTFVSTANAFVLRGARPIFVDIRPDTLNLDERLIENYLSDRTKVIVPVHYAGVGCEMEVITEIANRYGIAVVEDSAQGLFGRYKGRYLGTFGALSAQSFHETKNFTCGEGGALFVNDLDLVARAEIIREKGTNRSRFFRGQVDKYTWVDFGSSYLPSDMLAAFLLAQLEAHQLIQDKRRLIWQTYHDGLSEWAQNFAVKLPTIPSDRNQSYHMFYMLMPHGADRDRLIAYLKERGIQSTFHYQPLHLSTMGQRYGGRLGDCPVTESAADRLIRLPFHNHLTQDDLELVISAIRSFSCDVKSKLGY